MASFCGKLKKVHCILVIYFEPTVQCCKSHNHLKHKRVELVRKKELGICRASTAFELTFLIIAVESLRMKA